MTEPNDLITTVEACRVAGGTDTPFHPSTLWRWVKAGRISPPIKVGVQAVRFRRSVLERELGLRDD